jgi:uncharacterized protein (TIGR00251 family)
VLADVSSATLTDKTSGNSREAAPDALAEAITVHGDAVRVAVHAAPRASRTEVVGLHGGRLKVAVAAPPVDGEANAALVAFLADALGVRRADVSLLQGATGRQKIFAVTGVTRSEVIAALAPRAQAG